MMFNLLLAASAAIAPLAEPRRLECPNQVLEEWPEPRELPPLVGVRDLIYFEAGRPTLSEIARATLRDVAQCYQAIGDTHIYVVGHTDRHGTTDSNLALAQEYAEIVRDHLISQGVPATGISITSFGEDRPQAGLRTVRVRSGIAASKSFSLPTLVADS